jgi:hypothetical protein
VLYWVETIDCMGLRRVINVGGAARALKLRKYELLRIPYLVNRQLRNL